MKQKQCEHIWHIFHDKDLVATGFLSFYCERCLEQKKVKREYKE